MNIHKSRDPIKAMDTISLHLKDTGGIRKSSIKALVDLMKSVHHKLIPKCLAVNIIKASDEMVQFRLFRQGAWDILFQWLIDAQNDENHSFILELLSFYQSVPVTMELLTLNGCPKIIKQLSKYSETDISEIASQVVKKWRRTVELQNNQSSDNSDHSVKKRKFDTESKEDNQFCSDERKKRPTTVKIHPTHMRTAGLEDASESQLVKSRSEVLAKKGLTDNKVSNDKVVKEIKQQDHSPDVNLESMHQKIKVHPEKRRSSHEIQESSGFIDALFSSSQPALRKKKKLSSKSDTPPTKIPKKDDGLTSGIQDSQNNKSDDHRSTNSLDSSVSSSSNNDGMGPKKSSLMDLNSALDTEKKQKKRVSWAAADDLYSIHFFELDETERINVNRVSVEEMAKKEHLAEKQLFASGKRMSEDSPDPTGLLKWRNPPVLEGVPLLEHFGMNSTEKKVQADREIRVLQAIYFTKESIPNSPSEPDTESYEHAEPKLIPLDDVTAATPQTEGQKNSTSEKKSKAMNEELLIFQQEGDSKMSLNPQIADLVKSLAANYSSGENPKSESAINGFPSEIPTTQSLFDGKSIESVINGSPKSQLFSSIENNESSSKDDKMRAELMQLIHKNYPEINISELTVERVRELLEPLKDQLISRNIFPLPANHFPSIPPPRYQPYPAPGYNAGHPNGSTWGGHFGPLRGPIRGQIPPIGPRGLPKQPVCQYFMQGSCNKGAACAFMHPSVPPQNHHGARLPPRQMMHRPPFIPGNSGRGRMHRPPGQGFRPHHNFT